MLPFYLSRCSKWLLSVRMQACSLFWNASTARSIASCGRSSQIVVSSTVMSSALLVGFGVNTLYRASIAPQTWYSRGVRSGGFGEHSSFKLTNSGFRNMLIDPFFSKARRMGRCTILLEYEVVWQQTFTGLDELRKQIIHAEIFIHLHLNVSGALCLSGTKFSLQNQLTRLNSWLCWRQQSWKTFHKRLSTWLC